MNLEQAHAGHTCNTTVPDKVNSGHWVVNNIRASGPTICCLVNSYRWYTCNTIIIFYNRCSVVDQQYHWYCWPLIISDPHVLLAGPYEAVVSPRRWWLWFRRRAGRSTAYRQHGKCPVLCDFSVRKASLIRYHKHNGVVIKQAAADTRLNLNTSMSTDNRKCKMYRQKYKYTNDKIQTQTQCYKYSCVVVN